MVSLEVKYRWYIVVIVIDTDLCDMAPFELGSSVYDLAGSSGLSKELEATLSVPRFPFNLQTQRTYRKACPKSSTL